MKLALFTPGAYIWPVHRSFEGFIASLGCPAQDADSIHASRLYPAGPTDAATGLAESPQFGERLVRLHRDIYDALLRPAEFYRDSRESLGERFWPDMLGSPLDDLLSCLMFYFTRCSGGAVSITKGLKVLRAVFFNHEAAEPEHWLQRAYERLCVERVDLPALKVSLDAPATARISDLAFAIFSMQDSSPAGPGITVGRLQRGFDGKLKADCECGIDPSLAETGIECDVKERITNEIKNNLFRVFGWSGERAA